jgi:integrase/recombinase XerD
MTSLRAKYIRDLAIRGRATRTQQSYTSYVADLARYYRRSPDQISYEEVADWLHHLIKERHQSASSVNIAVNAVRFLYSVTLGRDVEALLASVPRMKRNTRRAEVYARSELEAILSAPRQPRDRAFLMAVYAGGLRLSEATHLKTTDLDRARMQWRVREGKGGNYAKVVVMQRLVFCNRAEPIFALYLARGWGSGKAGEIREKPAFCRFRPDQPTVQERLGSPAHGRQLPWHNSHWLRLKFTRTWVHA